MSSINQVILVGRLTKDAELGYTNTGKALTKVSMAVAGFKTGDVDFFDITIWGNTAEALTKYLEKGKQIAVAGRLKQDRWEGSNGEKRSKVIVVANEIQLLGSKNDEG